jgi:hypothetical protein
VTAQHRGSYSVNPGHAGGSESGPTGWGDASYCKAEANRVLDGDDACALRNEGGGWRGIDRLALW